MTDTTNNETTPKREAIPLIYMVYAYNTNIGGISKRVKGVYLTPQEAVTRQIELIPHGEFGLNGSRRGQDKHGRGSCAFIDTFPLGSGDTELHTTSITDWNKYV